MKINRILSLLIAGVVVAIDPAGAQSTATGVAPSATRPIGAVAPDSTPAKPAQRERRTQKRSRTDKTNAGVVDQNSHMNSSGTTTTYGPAAGSANSQDARYRQSSSSNGTSINNSNTTNYNTSNAINAPTGAGSNPATPPTPAEPVGNRPDGPATRSSGSDSNAGTAAAVSGARTSPTPAVAAGSTARTTSIGDFIASSPNYTTLQNALQSADLSETLKGTGPYTIFAPSNSAFKKLPASAQGGLLDGKNRSALKQLLSYHIVEGSVDTADLNRQIQAGNGKAQLRTLAGGTLTAQTGTNGRITIMDEQGHTAQLEAVGNRQANGTMYGIDTVLMPKSGAMMGK